MAFQLIGALYEKEGISPDEREDLLEYAAIATVADVMELKGENRGLVKSGLRALEHTKNKGLRALLEVQELSGKDSRRTISDLFSVPALMRRGELIP